MIVATPGIRSGKPRLAGTRTTVADVLGNLGAGMTPEEILEEHPILTKEMIQACLKSTATLTDRTSIDSAE